MTYYVLYVASPVFVSNAKILPISGSGDAGVSNIATQFGINIGGGSAQTNYFDGRVYPVILTSRDLLSKVLQNKFYTDKFQKNIRWQKHKYK